jgi:hypothetical protein
MAFVKWEIKGIQVSHCNCNVGCPCQFNALPTHGNCCAYMFMQIDTGHFGKVKLDGARWGRLYAWPGPIHKGGGTAMTILDETSSAEQRHAIDTIARGDETDPGTLITQVFSTVLSSTQPTQVRRIDLAINPRKRTARVQVADVIDSSVESIRNPVTGAPHRVSVNLPHGFEYRKAEFLTGKARTAPGPIRLEFDGTHAHIARVHWNTHGVAG